MNSVLEKPVFKTWKTIKLGTGLKSAEDFRNAAKIQGMGICEWSYEIIGQPDFIVSDHEMEIELVLTSVAELGFSGDTARRYVRIRAEESGLDLCPFEVAPQLLLQCTDQQKGEYLIVETDYFKYSNYGLFLFDINDINDECELGANNGYPESILPSHRRLVFVRRK